VNLYDSDQVRDQLGGEVVDHYSPLGLLVLCGRRARVVIVENLTCTARGGANHCRFSSSNCHSISVVLRLTNRGLLFLDLTNITLWTLTRSDPQGLMFGIWSGYRRQIHADGEARLMALPAKTCGSRLSSQISIINPYVAQMLCRNQMCFQPYRVNWFVEVLIRVTQLAVDISALHLS